MKQTVLISICALLLIWVPLEKTIRQGRINWVNHDPEWKDLLGFRGENDFEAEIFFRRVDLIPL